MQNDPNLRVDVFGIGEVSTIHFNPTIAPLDKLEVRQAIAYALDRDELVNVLGGRASKKVYSAVPAQLMPGGLNEAEATDDGIAYATDRNKSRQLVTSAGFPNGFRLNVVTSEQTAYSSIYASIRANSPTWASHSTFRPWTTQRTTPRYVKTPTRSWCMWHFVRMQTPT